MLEISRWAISGANKPGILVECEPSIKSIIINIDRQNHDYIIEDLDETHLVIKENMLARLKMNIEEVSFLLQGRWSGIRQVL